MRFFLSGTALVAIAFVALGGVLSPLSIKEVSLMLRSGYSSDAVQHELAVRHFVGSLDVAAEKDLTRAGASPTLINGLKSGAFAIPASEMAAVQTELAAKEQRRARELEQSRKLDTLYQAQQAQKRASSPMTPTASAMAIAPLVKGTLVTSQNGILRAYLDGEFEKKKLIGLFFSAHWCAPCRKFTPSLVAFYNKVAAAHPEFEILFISNDKSAAAMESYMRDDQMPWPAVSFDKVAGNQALKKYAGSAIPCLVIVDDTGKVIFDTYAGQNYRGPEAVLAELEQFFAAKSPSQLAQTR
jgi:thiol-disulfide isomerase/thioredoxin